MRVQPTEEPSQSLWGERATRWLEAADTAMPTGPVDPAEDPDPDPPPAAPALRPWPRVFPQL